MSSIINADTSDGVKITSDTSGELKLQSAGTDIVTVNSTGIAVASGKSLSVEPKVGLYYASSGTTVNHATTTTIAIDTVAFENLDGAFNTSTYTFTAPYAGKYRITAQAYKDSTNASYRVILYVRKNGSSVAKGYVSNPNGTEWFGAVSTTTILDVALNDAILVNTYILDASSASANIDSGLDDTFLAIEYLGDF